MYYADLRKYDTSNWSGINSTLFVSGCKHCCEGCWNKEAWNFKYGKPYTEIKVEDIKEESTIEENNPLDLVDKMILSEADNKDETKKEELVEEINPLDLVDKLIISESKADNKETKTTAKKESKTKTTTKKTTTKKTTTKKESKKSDN